MEEGSRVYDDNGYMIMTGDYHTHTVYSHGKGTVEDNVVRARELGLTSIGITDHGIDHFIYGVSYKNLLKQRAEIEALRKKYTDINILFGVESDLKGLSGRIDLTEEQRESFDIILCGFHKPVWADKVSDYFRLFYNSYSKEIYRPTAKQIANNTRAYINMIKTYPVDVITHINYHIKVDCYEVAKACEDYGTILELSSRHQDLSEDDYEAMLKTNVKFIVNSDAHRVADIGACGLAKEVIKKYGIPPERIVNSVAGELVLRSKR